jgi:cell division protein FtsQ
MVNPNNNSSKQQKGFAEKIFDNLSKVITLMLCCFLLYGSFLAYKHLDKPITKVTIEGEFRQLDHRELEALVNGQIQGGFISIDLTKLQKVLQQHPWVSRVGIQRQWPSQLQINVVEEVPMARWNEDAFLNRFGDKLTIDDNSHLASLPLLNAEFGSSSEVMKQYQRLAQLLLPTGLKLSKLNRNGLGGWYIETSKGIRLIIGRNQVGEKIRRLVLVWESDLYKRSDSIETIDLRYPNGVAVAWRDQTTVSALKTDTTSKDSVING